ncbi:P-loop containing nucleoside triphosphate hydrolase protein [Rhypophila decipiens]|uniref:P-loop containing nucleoside triphosphate hydrolase protein n=1 Tax=Rhypophila decipiens TaxID=261697 RepID=A0AAN6Y1E0_9PEZI|nr:P-loop containing nucleoside triphosphate hydrolase protein [Rhypophila decipiens]
MRPPTGITVVGEDPDKDVTSPSESDDPPTPGRPAKRTRHQPASTSSSRILILHRVNCFQSGSDNHASHPAGTRYLDNPRLFKGDSGASLLRGLNPIPRDLDSFLEESENEDIGLVIIRYYNCQSYHHSKTVRESFVHLRRPKDPPIPANMCAYFQVLDVDGPLAVAESESVYWSKEGGGGGGLNRGLETLAQLCASDPDLKDIHRGLEPPYLRLWHARGKIRERAVPLLGQLDGSRVLLQMDYVENAFGREWAAAEEEWKRGVVSRRHLAKMFRPNEVVVTTDDDGEPRCYLSMACPSPRDDPLMLQCYAWGYDGRFRRERSILRIPWPVQDSGPIPIKALRAYPLRFETTGKSKKELLERGQMFWKCRKRLFVGYDAPSTSFEIQVSNPRYMVDMATYLELHQKESTATGGQSSLHHVQGLAGDSREEDIISDELINDENPPGESFLLLLPSKILGFGLHDKKWKSLLVKHMHPVRWNKRAFEKLVLDNQKKELIEAMVTIHMNSNMSTDVIEGKGKGLIILLHGGPGTGKTLTAESVAELAERPLYRVTCGDIGTDAESVERYLESVLYIGSIWKAVVLLDESDVFLEEREKTDLQRNALVSVFLRVLEYYEGILILTSNRVGIFDEAFKSRVQLALHYPPLEEDGRWHIWDNFFKILQKQQDAQAQSSISLAHSGLAEDEKINVDELLDKTDALAKENLNGRQIRNAITSARQLARFRKKPLGYAHLQQTIGVINEFERYVESTHGHSAGEYAKASGTRCE